SWPRAGAVLFSNADFSQNSHAAGSIALNARRTYAVASVYRCSAVGAAPTGAAAPRGRRPSSNSAANIVSQSPTRLRYPSATTDEAQCPALRWMHNTSLTKESHSDLNSGAILARWTTSSIWSTQSSTASISVAGRYGPPPSIAASACPQKG